MLIVATIIFYGKPGCKGNARQRAILEASGHEVDARSLSAEPWSGERLRSFFGDLPVADWFNPSAPRVAKGEIRPETLDAGSALALLVAEPLLIRRPLLEANGQRLAGWDPDRIAAWVGLNPDLDPAVSCGHHGGHHHHDHDHGQDHGHDHGQDHGHDHGHDHHHDHDGSCRAR
jgi:nitrogenase-associated protein